MNLDILPTIQSITGRDAILSKSTNPGAALPKHLSVSNNIVLRFTIGAVLSAQLIVIPVSETHITSASEAPVADRPKAHSWEEAWNADFQELLQGNPPKRSRQYEALCEQASTSLEGKPASTDRIAGLFAKTFVEDKK